MACYPELGYDAPYKKIEAKQQLEVLHVHQIKSMGLKTHQLQQLH